MNGEEIKSIVNYEGDAKKNEGKLENNKGHREDKKRIKWTKKDRRGGDGGQSCNRACHHAHKRGLAVFDPLPKRPSQ